MNNKPSDAKFSHDGQYRYALWRNWDTTLPKVQFIGLNPSNAGKFTADPTITRIENFSKAHGYGGFIMTNLFAFITARPKELSIRTQADRENDRYIQKARALSKDVVFCWGAFKKNNRHQEMVDMFPGALCFGLTKYDRPRHPLYLKADTKLISFEEAVKAKKLLAGS